MDHRELHSFPTRRSSDLQRGLGNEEVVRRREAPCLALVAGVLLDLLRLDHEVRDVPRLQDRKSTRLNSSHQIISYAVFCSKKKKRPPATPTTPSVTTLSE